MSFYNPAVLLAIEAVNVEKCQVSIDTFQHLLLRSREGRILTALPQDIVVPICFDDKRAWTLVATVD